MKGLILVLGFCALAGGIVNGQSRVPEAGLAAEGKGHWADAVKIYRGVLADDPQAAELWLRIADIEARLGHPDESIAALDGAAAAAPDDATVHARLSQSHASAGQPAAAVRAIEAALAVQPDSAEYLRAHATLATWAGEYEAAATSYRALHRTHPGDENLMLALARVNMWDGKTDAAVSAYRVYLASSALPVPDAWLELARSESWRGNAAGALGALSQYHVRFGETSAYSRELAATLARGGRPLTALRQLDALLAGVAGDYDLDLSRTVALASAGRHGAAIRSLRRAGVLRPHRAETRATEHLLRSLLGSNVGSSATFYSDSDGLTSMNVSPRFDVGFLSDTRLRGGYEHIELRARAGSGLDQISGAGVATVEHVYAGLSQRLGALTVVGTIGQARPESHQMTTYAGSVQFAPADTFVASLERSSGFAAISPRSAGLGLERLDHKAQIDWRPSVRLHLALEGSREDLSDGNLRWEVFASSRVAVLRTQHVNLDMGLLLHQFGAKHDLDNGYYDPNRYESYSFFVSPYWKASENIGVSASAGLGSQRDDASRTFRTGNNASVEATFGIYERWALKVHASTTNNRRLDSGAFNGHSGGATLLRRF